MCKYQQWFEESILTHETYINYAEKMASRLRIWNVLRRYPDKIPTAKSPELEIFIVFFGPSRTYGSGPIRRTQAKNVALN